MQHFSLEWPEKKNVIYSDCINCHDPTAYKMYPTAKYKLVPIQMIRFLKAWQKTEFLLKWEQKSVLLYVCLENNPRRIQ